VSSGSVGSTKHPLQLPGDGAQSISKTLDLYTMKSHRSKLLVEIPTSFATEADATCARLWSLERA